MTRKRAVVLGAGALAALLSGCSVFAEYHSDMNFGLGVRGQVPVSRFQSDPNPTAVGPGLSSPRPTRLQVAGSLHRFSPNDANVTVANVSGIAPLIRIAEDVSTLYAGAGLHIGRESRSDDRSIGAGGHLLGGLAFQHRTAAPFFEVRGGFGSYGSMSVLGGVRFFAGNE